MAVTLGKKIGMTRVFEKEGTAIPVTLIDVSKAKVSETKEGKVCLEWDVKKGSQCKKEFKVEKTEAKAGDKVKVEEFKVGDKIKVSGISKGKGFQGVVKRHGFKGGPASHGHRHVLRSGGSIGGAFPQHVRKGMRMAGRMGADKTTFETKVVEIDKDKGVLAVKGGTPGGRNNFLRVWTV